MRHLTSRRLLAGLVVTMTAIAVSGSPASAAANGLTALVPDITVGAGSSGGGYLVASSEQPVSTTEVTVTFDTTGLTGVAEVATEPDPWVSGFTCETAGALITCSRTASWPVSIETYPVRLFDFTVTAAAGAQHDDSGTLAYTLTTDGRSASGTTRVIIGEGVDLAPSSAEPVTVSGTPGTTIDAPVGVRNVGETTVSGAILYLFFQDEITLARTYSNCYYQVGRETTAYCEFDRDLLPGVAYTARPRLDLGTSIESPGLTLGSLRWLTPTDWNDGNGIPYVQGTGTELTLEEEAFSAARRTQVDVNPYNNWSSIIIELTGHNPADLAAIGATVDGPAGSTRTIRVGMRNDGPASAGVAGSGEAAAQMLVRIPAGTRIIAADGNCWRSNQHGGYVCGYPGSLFPAGTEAFFSLTLRIDQEIPNATATVSVNEVNCGSCDDGNRANDVAYVVVNGDDAA
ncbi:hypothetical protein [Catenuloplanes indicus]|uniref:CARDB domain-containing protein n=1 Tax=Catenuloplanes indicus TaxID=137267 RepID=A0AAE3W1B7_9ACTN|nr:hypothetical protein [Catenuloplanes indicus]MDQ0367898.1 hypothetical protein [Catenuloplanes indicus]